MSSSVISDLQGINPSSIIELFELTTTTALHGSATTYRFHAGSSLNANGEIIWQGNSYQRFPVEATGFAFQKGQIPRPTLTVSNALGTITSILLTVNETTTGNDLTGATVTRIRTLAKFLDNANFPQQKTSVTTVTPDPNFVQTITLTVTVVNVDGANVFVINDSGQNLPISMTRASTYIFDQSDSSNSGHPFAIKSDAGGAQTTTVTGTAGNAGATVTYTPAYPSAPNDLRYYCTVHGNAMGSTITMNDPPTVSSTEFTNSIQVNPFGTPANSEFPREIYSIDRKSAETRDAVSFELAAPIDLAGVRAPKRQCTRKDFPSIGRIRI